MELLDILVYTVIGVGWVFRKGAKLIGLAWRATSKWRASAVVGKQAETPSTATSVPPAAKSAPAAASKTPATSAGVATKSNAAPAGRFEVADRNIIVRFGQGWSVTVRVYGQRGVAERLLRCTEAGMVKQLQYTYLKSVFPLEPVSLREHSLEEVLRDCEVAGPTKAAELLRRLGDPQVEPLVSRKPAETAEAAPVETAPAATSEPIAEARPAPAVPARTATGPGRKIQGRVVEAGQRQSTTGGMNFEVTIETDDGQEVKRGWHLSELFTRLKVGVGDNVVITDLGRKPIEPGLDGQRRFKTVYDVQRV
jgi:hypothetical protein